MRRSLIRLSFALALTLSAWPVLAHNHPPSATKIPDTPLQPRILIRSIALYEAPSSFSLFPSSRNLASGSSSITAEANVSGVSGLGAESRQGADYMHARFYSPTTGRFLSPDPSLDIDHAMSHPQAWNRYSYVENNPIGKIDPNGRDAWDVINGFSNAFVNDLGLTVRRDGGNSDYQRGQVGGDQAGVVSGFVIAGAFAGAEGTFTVATAGAGAVAVPVAAVGVGYGLAVSANSGLHLKSDVQANQAQGKAGEQKVIKALEAQGNDVTPQVRKNTPFGPRVIDAEVSKNGKVLGGVEVKTGNSAYNASQRAKDAWLRNTLDYIVNVIRLAK